MVKVKLPCTDDLVAEYLDLVAEYYEDLSAGDLYSILAERHDVHWRTISNNLAGALPTLDPKRLMNESFATRWDEARMKLLNYRVPRKKKKKMVIRIIPRHKVPRGYIY